MLLARGLNVCACIFTTGQTTRGYALSPRVADTLCSDLILVAVVLICKLTNINPYTSLLQALGERTTLSLGRLSYIRF